MRAPLRDMLMAPPYSRVPRLGRRHEQGAHRPWILKFLRRFVRDSAKLSRLCQHPFVGRATFSLRLWFANNVRTGFIA